MMPKNKAPLTLVSHGTPVKQPSPKCCSRTTLRFHPASRNGTDGPCAGPKAYPEKHRPIPSNAAKFGHFPRAYRCFRNLPHYQCACDIQHGDCATDPRLSRTSDGERGRKSRKVSSHAAATGKQECGAHSVESQYLHSCEDLECTHGAGHDRPLAGD